MLVLTRRVGESICIGPDVIVTVTDLSAGKVRIGIQAPPNSLILRGELVDRAGVPAPINLSHDTAAGMPTDAGKPC